MASLTPLTFSPRGPRAALPAAPPSIRGRLTRLRPAHTLSAFLSVSPAASSASESDASPAHDALHFDHNRRRRSRRPKSRIARPKDAMPGFKRRRHFRAPGRGPGGGGRGGFRGGRGGGMTVGAAYLDRGSSAAAYYGREGGGEVDGEGGGVGVELGEREREVLGEEVGGGGRPAPVCFEHGEECARLKCKKVGRNKGREFYKCAKKQRYEQCDFFRWVDEDYGEADGDEGGNAGGNAGGEEGEGMAGKGVEAREAPALIDNGDCNERLDAALRDVFEYGSFRAGQREAVLRLAEGRSVLALMPTGAGKSLVYQAFAAVTPGLVIVVTPLVSLMLDQLSSLPEQIPGACLRSGQSMDVVRKTEEKVAAGKVKVLFVSPERLFSGRFRAFMSGHGAPRVSLVVVDEAHCISQWSHNFRTAYLRIPRVLFGRGVGEDQRAAGLFAGQPPVLALSATATRATVTGICEKLGIKGEDGVIRCASARDNLSLTLSHVEGPLEAKAYELVRRLKLEPFGRILGLIQAEEASSAQIRPRIQRAAGESAAYADVHEDGGDCTPRNARKRSRSGAAAKNVDEDKILGWGSNLHVSKRIRGPRQKPKHLGSVIVYVSKQRDCEAVCNYIKSSPLQLSGKVSMYHAGMAQKDRAKTQSQFEAGSIAVLVATVAFGMGLNYANVLGVIHFDMPSSLEAYSQEIGRAGRDGRSAACHVFYSKFDGCRLRSRSHSDGVDESVVRQFLRRLCDSCFEHKQIRQHMQEWQKTDAGEPDFAPEASQSTGNEKVILFLSEHDLSRNLDVKCETAETVCAILEGKLCGVSLLRASNTKVRIRFFSQTPEALLESRSCTPVDKLVIELILKRAKQTNGQFDLMLHKACLLEDDIVASLRRLQNARHISFELMERGLLVQCTESGFSELKGSVDQWASVAHADLAEIEDVRGAKADAVVATFSEADGMLTDGDQSAFLHKALADYFAADGGSHTNAAFAGAEGSQGRSMQEVDVDEGTIRQVEQACKTVLHDTQHGNLRAQTGRQIARILHGIDSAGFRAKDWWKCGHWGKFVQVDFSLTVSLARAAIREHHTRRHERRP